MTGEVGEGKEWLKEPIRFIIMSGDICLLPSTYVHGWEIWAFYRVLKAELEPVGPVIRMADFTSIKITFKKNHSYPAVKSTTLWSGELSITRLFRTGWMAICYDLLPTSEHTSQSPICNSETKGPDMWQNSKEPSRGIGPRQSARGPALTQEPGPSIWASGTLPDEPCWPFPPTMVSVDEAVLLPGPQKQAGILPFILSTIS